MRTSLKSRSGGQSARIQVTLDPPVAPQEAAVVWHMIALLLVGPNWQAALLLLHLAQLPDAVGGERSQILGTQQPNSAQSCEATRRLQLVVE